MVCTTFHLVSVPLAGFEDTPKSDSDTPGPRRRSWLPRKYCVHARSILFAQGAMLAGLFASRVLYHGEKLLSFKLEAGSFVAFFVAVIFGPLLMFAPQMASARRKGLADYGLL